jgi:hypothetical protein
MGSGTPHGRAPATAWYNDKYSLIRRPARASDARRHGVSGKEDKQNMAKTIRKTETGNTAAKPAAQRKTAATAAPGAAKVTTRRRTKLDPEVPAAAAIANDRPARMDRPVAAAPGSEPTHDQIALRAYHIFLRRGTAHGHAANDWFQARAELLRERGPKP